MTKTFMRVVSLLMTFALIAPMEAIPSKASAQEGSKPVFSEGELEQVVAPVALYPDDLLAQILMASTYPLEVVQAERWVKQHKDLKGEALAAALEKQQWDPSVKSLVAFPQILDMMNEKLEWTQKLGDAFLAQQKDVMDTIQKLRKKADAEGNLKTTKEQKVIVEKETQTIIIQPADPQVVYVPTYNPTVVYGAWPYPAYPPYYYQPPPYYYPPGYVAGAAVFGFAAGVAVGAAWGYAWGNCNWRGGDVNVNVNRNASFNNNINRSSYSRQYQGGSGKWQHNAEHRKGVAYRDRGTSERFNRASTQPAIKSRENFRGRAEAGRQNIGRGDAGGRGQGGQAATRPAQSAGGRGQGAQASTRPAQGAGGRGQGAQASTRPAQGAGGRDFSGQKSGAFSGMDRGGGATRDMSNRGSSSRQSMSSGSRGGGGGSRGGGGGSRGGGGRGGGGGRR